MGLWLPCRLRPIFSLSIFSPPGLAGLFNGIIYVLIIKKCPKIGTQFIIPAIYGLYFLFTGSVYVFIFFMILAIFNELIMLGGGYQSKIRSAVPHALTWMLNAMGSTLTMLLFPGQPGGELCGYGYGRNQRGCRYRIPGGLLAGAAEHRHRPGGRSGTVHRRLCAGYENVGQTLLNRLELRNGSRKAQALSA